MFVRIGGDGCNGVGVDCWGSLGMLDEICEGVENGEKVGDIVGGVRDRFGKELFW